MTNTFSQSLGSSWYRLVPLYTNFASIRSVVLWLRQICKLKLLQSVNFCKSVSFRIPVYKLCNILPLQQKNTIILSDDYALSTTLPEFSKRAAWWQLVKLTMHLHQDACLFSLKITTLKKSWQVTDDEQVAFSV